jgi:hypothetical protein
LRERARQLGIAKGSELALALEGRGLSRGRDAGLER